MPVLFDDPDYDRMARAGNIVLSSCVLGSLAVGGVLCMTPLDHPVLGVLLGTFLAGPVLGGAVGVFVAKMLKD